MIRPLLLLTVIIGMSAGLASAQAVSPPGMAPAMPEAPVQAAPQTAGGTATPQAAEAPLVTKLTTYQSMMYSKEDQALLKEVLDAIKNDTPLPGIEEVAPEPQANVQLEEEPEPQVVSRYYRYPQFYLTSIAYFQPNHWVIWVNGKKITSRQPKIIRRLKVKEVTDNQVVFEFTFLPEDRSDFSKPSDDERIIINEADRMVTFMLKPNQTFSSYNWKIFEGKVKQAKEPTEKKSSSIGDMLPSVSDIFSGSSASPSGAYPPEVSIPLSAPSGGMTPISPQEKTGLGGLMNRYQAIENPIAPPSQSLPQSRPNAP